MILAIDAGNTRLKWAVFQAADPMNTALKAHGICVNRDLHIDSELPPAWRDCQRAVISNVAGKPMAEIIHAMLCQLDISMLWLAASAQACGVRNSYSQPKQLGSDRWAALIAAWQRYHEPCLVVTAGTALTIDALGVDEQRAGGIFLGGLIVPGFKLMQDCLPQATAGIPAEAGANQGFPNNTADALHTGTLSAMVGAVASMFVKLQLREGAVPRCILSGGDASLLAEAIKRYDLISSNGMAKNLAIADNLVLQGLLLLERETL